MYDTLIKGATLVDGLGGPGVTGDLAIAGGRIAAVGGRITGSARETLDAGGTVVTPAWVDIHTHYDAASGFVASYVNGIKTRQSDRDTGARPGRLVRSR